MDVIGSHAARLPARLDAAGLLGVKRHLIAAVGVQQIVRGRVPKIESQCVQRAVLLTRPRIEPKRDEIVAECEIAQYIARD